MTADAATCAETGSALIIRLSARAVSIFWGWFIAVCAACRLCKVRTGQGSVRNRLDLTLRTPDGHANAAQMIIYLDRQPIGFLSDVEEDTPLELPKLTPGRHLVQAVQVWLYRTEPSGIKSEVARGLQSEIEFQSTGKPVNGQKPSCDRFSTGRLHGRNSNRGTALARKNHAKAEAKSSLRARKLSKRRAASV